LTIENCQHDHFELKYAKIRITDRAIIFAENIFYRMKTVIDILSIALPLLLIVFGFMRVGVNQSSKSGSAKIKALNSLTLLTAIILLLIGIVRYLFPMGSGGSNHSSGEKPKPIAVSEHTNVFNNSLDVALNAYYKMTEGFVNWDTMVIHQSASELITALDSVKTTELKKDTSKYADKIYLTAVDFIANAKNETVNILQQPSIDKKREMLNELTDNLRNLLITVKYDKNKIYYQECPMAFNDEIPGYWLSASSNVRNPYLGTKHPKYNATMLSCGKPRDSIDFSPADTVK
jgi:hypothetical protein